MVEVRTIRRNLSTAGLALVILTAMGAPGQADLYYFKCITDNSAANAAIGEAQLSVDVTAGATAQQVRFDFYNIGPDASSITDIYFDDGTLLGIAAVYNSTGVHFTQNMPGNTVSPANLPGAHELTPPFEAVADFSADSDAPTQRNGVNPGETVGILFNLQTGGTFDDVISELASRELRIGIKVQGFENGGSEGFVDSPRVPLPGAVLLGSVGLGMAGWRLRGRKELA